MRRRTICVLVAAVGLLAWVAAAAGEWVPKDGQAHAVAAGMHAVFLGDEGGERFDLADLRDGETRLFGEGDKQLTARRSGDEVVLSRPPRGDESELRIVCRLSSDRCSVVTFDDAPEKVLLIVEKTRECVGDAAECTAAGEIDVDVLSGIGEPGAHVFLHKVECTGDDCAESEDVRAIAGIGGPHTIKILRSGGPDEVSLRCPEGDTTMRVERSEAEKTYLCPKHSLPLKKARIHAGSVRVLAAH